MVKTVEQFGNSILNDVYYPRVPDALGVDVRRIRWSTIADEAFDALTALDRYTCGLDVSAGEAAAAANLRNNLLELMPLYEARGAGQDVLDGIARLVVDLSLEGQIDPGIDVDEHYANPIFWSSRVVDVVQAQANVELARTYPKQNPCVYY